MKPMAKGYDKSKAHNSVTGRYYMPESMPLVLCGACLLIALEYSEKAKGIYNKIVESYRLPDIRAAFNELELELPDREVMFIEVVRGLTRHQQAAY